MERKLHILKLWLSRKVVLLPVIIFTVLMVAAALYWFVHQNNWLSKDYLKQQEITRHEENFRDLIYNVQRAESDVRGYIVTRNKIYVSDFNKIIDSIQVKYSHIKTFEKATPLAFDSELSGKFNSLLTEKTQFLQQVKSLCDNDKWNEASSLINSPKGLYLSDSIYTINQLKNNELRLYNDHSGIAFLDIKKTNTNLAYAGIGFSVFLLILIVYLLRREIQRSNNLTGQLNKQKEFFKATVESIGEGLIATSKKSEIVFMNPAAEKLTGWNFSEAKHKQLSTVYKVFNEETGLPFNNIVSRILEEGKSIELENNTLLKSRNNDYFIISNSGAPMQDEVGNVTGAVLVFNDITEKKKNETELRESERQFRFLIENLSEAVYTCDELGYIQLYNKAAVKLWGREPLAGKELWCGSWKIFNTDGTELPHDRSPMALALKTGRPVLGKEILVKRKDGSFRHVLPSPTPSFDNEGKLIGAVNLLLDVTDKKEREILIRKTEEKYRNLFEQGNDAIVTYSFDGTIYEFNDIICSMSGYTREEFAQLKLQDIIVGDLILSEEKYNAILAGELVTVQRQCRRKDGGGTDMEFKTKMNTEGIIVAFGRDITERKRNEEKIKNAIERFEILSRATSDTIWDWNIKEDTITYNRGMTKMFGYRLADIKARAQWWKENTHPDDNDHIDKQLAELFAARGQNIQMEYRYLCANGSYKYVNDRAFVLYNAEGQPVRMVGAMQDVTKEKNHARLITMAVVETQENERRELGMELHDNVNQLLSATLLYLGMATRSSKDGADVSETLQECIRYITDAITDIRNLSHRLTPFTDEKVPLNEIIKWLTEPMQKTDQFEINLQVDERVDDIISNDIKTNFYRIIQEQLNNIVKYAQAGKVEISITVVEDKVSLVIADNGIGFDPELVKDGIGLQNIKRRAEMFFGELSLKTSPGNGCVLTIEQPCS